MQASIANLVEQGAIADSECACRLFAIPVMMLQDFQNDLALQFTHTLSRHLLQRNRSVEGNLGAEEVGLTSDQVVGDHFLMAEDHIALDQVFEFTNIARPMILLQYRKHLVR